jgi:hypothetical protein
VASRFVCPVAYQPLSRAALNKLRQLGDVRCYPPRLVAREQLGCNVRFVPITDMANERSSALFHLHHATVVLHLHTAAPDGRSRG